jgi:serine/threonine protein phosphatase PrpC
MPELTPELNQTYQGAAVVKGNELPESENVITKFAFATRVGFIPNNDTKVNQDSFILSPNFLNNFHQHFFGVCDGHGACGRDVSNYIKVKLPA